MGLSPTGPTNPDGFGNFSIGDGLPELSDQDHVNLFDILPSDLAELVSTGDLGPRGELAQTAPVLHGADLDELLKADSFDLDDDLSNLLDDGDLLGNGSVMQLDLSEIELPEGKEKAGLAPTKILVEEVLKEQGLSELSSDDSEKLKAEVDDIWSKIHFFQDENGNLFVPRTLCSHLSNSELKALQGANIGGGKRIYFISERKFKAVKVRYVASWTAVTALNILQQSKPAAKGKSTRRTGGYNDPSRDLRSRKIVVRQSGDSTSAERTEDDPVTQAFSNKVEFDANQRSKSGKDERDRFEQQDQERLKAKKDFIEGERAAYDRRIGGTRAPEGQ